MIPMSLRDVAVLTGGSLHPPTAGDLMINGSVVTDSREASIGSLYVARVGEHADGHDYVGDAAKRGARAALTSRPVDELPSVVVDDVQSAFGRLARGVVDRKTDMRIVGITGSSGKTTTKDLLAQVLARADETVAPASSLNGEIGVPLTVCRVTPWTKFLVVEMGARRVGHIRYLTSIAPPDIAIVLNVGRAHVGEFGSREAIARAKGELVEALAPDGVAVLNADDPLVTAMASRTEARVVTVGVVNDADVRAHTILTDQLGRATFTLQAGSHQADVELQLSGAHQVGNALAAAAAALNCGMNIDDVAKALSSACPLNRWRMEITERSDGVTVVNDAYNANPESMRAGLETLVVLGHSRPPGSRTWAVLGEMLELGAESWAAHQELGRRVVELGIDRLVVVGGGATGIAAGAEAAGGAAQTHTVPSVDDAYDLLDAELVPGDIVFLKSSRDSGLRWLGDRLAGLKVPS